MGQPRFARGAPVSAGALNQMAFELDMQGLACKVRRSSTASTASSTDYITTWQVEDYDTFGGGMWSPAAPTYIVIRYDGTYHLEAQTRWGTSAGGSRAGKILVNSTNVFDTYPPGGPVTSMKIPAQTDGEGTTISMQATMQLYTGDRVYVNYWQSSGSTINACYQDFGGTYLAVARIAPLS